ncbi:MAG: T9SS type A sorting domain-containing protein [candidate division Zixibacteria bacterium]|nr:T9SS type A sorting domain-containing protein [candidate division Zixibacteria bacterium]
MKKNVPLLTIVIFLVLGNITARGYCPEDPNDRGECDTMYVEPWPDDTLLQGDPPYFVRVPIYVTCDVVDSSDSIIGFTIPLCYTHSNPSKYCSVSAHWNNTKLVPFSGLERSIFRHLEISPGDTMFNRMMSLSEPEEDLEWDTFILNLDDTSHFWLSMISVSQGQSWWEGSRVLLATMTFKVEDSMQICIDTCLWPPQSRLAWAISEVGGHGFLKIPRLGSPHETSYEVCFNLHKPADVREIHSSEEGRPSEFSLSQNYPNPFNPTTSFQLSLSKSVHVKIEIFNIIGQKVRTLLDEEMNPGVYMAEWDGEDEKGRSVSSGIYFYRVQAGDFSGMKKMVLLK